MIKSTSLRQRILDVISNRKFLWVIVGLLIFEAGWIALSGRYPMAFDEDYHLGIINLYAHHISPFWANQPENADRFGAVARDPSYLYQYLMSFPYRVITSLTNSQTAIVLFLRFIDIGLVSASLVLCRRLLLKTKASLALVHTCLLIFVLLPIVPLLAAQINYDNLLLPLIPLTLLLALQYDERLHRDKKIDALYLISLVVACLIACLVKYAFLPIMLAIFIFVLWRSWRQRRRVGGLIISFLSSWKTLSRYWQAGLLIALVLSLGLFWQRFGINIVRYHSPVPDCSKVLRVEQCREYGPWIRDYDFALNKIPGPHGPITYAKEWFYGVWLRTLFAVSGSGNDFETHGPLLLPAIGSIVIAVGGILGVIVGFKRLLKKYSPAAVWLLLIISFSYLAFLWFDEYQAYLSTGQPVAINGRYLLPVFLPLLLLAAASFKEITNRFPRLQVIVASLAILSLAWGGGALTFILRSSDSWLWPNSTVRAVNSGVRNTVGRITPGYYTPTLFLR